MSKDKSNLDGLDNLDNYFMSITYMLKFLTYINKPSEMEIQDNLNDILLKIKEIKEKQVEKIEKGQVNQQKNEGKISSKIEKAINFIAFNIKAELEKPWEKKWTADKMRNLFEFETKGVQYLLDIKDDDPLIVALFHVVDLMSRNASIIVLNKRIISSGYDTVLPINSNLDKIIDLDKKDKNDKYYVKKYTIIKSVVNAINNSANVQSSTKGATIYTTSILTEKDVYFAIQAEIKEIIYLEIDYIETSIKSTPMDFSYDKESEEVIAMLLESGIKYKKMLINTETEEKNFLKSIIDFGYYYKEGKRLELWKFTKLLDKLKPKIKEVEPKIKEVEPKIKEPETWVNTIFMAISYIVSFRSFDDGSKVGCSFVKRVEFGGVKQYILYSTGYNGFPNTLSRFHNKEKKQEYMVHAETNAILSIIKNNAKVHEYTIVYSNLYSCDECLKSLFNIGVKEIIYFEERYKKQSEIQNENLKCSFLSNEEHLKNTKLFNKNENNIIKPFIESFISFYKFHYFFNDIDNLIEYRNSVKEEVVYDEIKRYITNYYSNYKLSNFLQNDKHKHKTIFNKDEKLGKIKKEFKDVINLIKNYVECQKNVSILIKNYVECQKKCDKNEDEKCCVSNCKDVSILIKNYVECQKNWDENKDERCCVSNYEDIINLECQKNWDENKDEKCCVSNYKDIINLIKNYTEFQNIINFEKK